jgi:NADH:ubiquinone oxidoreductase subunit 4 (subunit M)
MFRFLFQTFNFVGTELIFVVLIIGLVGLLYGSLAALNQMDFKKIVAYSSIAHMNFLLIVLFSQSLFGLAGAFFLMFGHAFTSAAFFFSLGVLYDRYKTRLIFYYGGFVMLMPVFAVLVFFVCLANFGFPGTFNFVGEFLILAGNFESSIVILFFVAACLILATIYSLFFFVRILFGPLLATFVRYFCDISRLEFYVISCLILIIIYIGFMPNMVLQYGLLLFFRQLVII